VAVLAVRYGAVAVLVECFLGQLGYHLEQPTQLQSVLVGLDSHLQAVT
jgi:hypothetical protein